MLSRIILLLMASGQVVFKSTREQTVGNTSHDYLASYGLWANLLYPSKHGHQSLGQSVSELSCERRQAQRRYYAPAPHPPPPPLTATTKAQLYSRKRSHIQRRLACVSPTVKVPTLANSRTETETAVIQYLDSKPPKQTGENIKP